MNYKILSAPIESIDQLEREVDSHLREGWKLAGGLATRAYTHSKIVGSTRYDTHECKMFQAVYKPLGGGE